MARPARPEQTKSARSSRQLSRFWYLINPDKVFGTHKDGQNETEQPDHSASLVDSITSSTRIRFSVHTGLRLQSVKAAWRSRLCTATLQTVDDIHLSSSLRARAAFMKSSESKSHELGPSFPAHSLLDLLTHY